MHFEVWGMQWFPKGRGLPFLKERSPGVHSQQNLECTPHWFLLLHTPTTQRDWEEEPRAFAEVLGVCSLSSPSCLHEGHFEQNHVRGTYLAPNNNLSSSLDKFATTGSETLGGNWDQSGL